jgi:CheY-like chemotaxis protein
MRQLLEGAGHEVADAPTGTDALRLLRKHPARLVVLMGTEVGTELLDVAVREAEIGRHAFVLVTALWDMLPAAWQEAVHRWHLPVVPKPFRQDELLGTVAEVASALGADGGM